MESTLPENPRAEDFTTLVRLIAVRYAHCSDDIPDLIQEGLVALLIAFRKTPHPTHLTTFVYRVVSRAIWGYYSTAQARRERVTHSLFSDAGDEEEGREGPVPLDLIYDPEDYAQVDLVEQFLGDLQGMYGRRARLIVEWTMDPSESFGEFIKAAIEAKHQQAAEGFARRGYQHTIRRSRVPIYQSLGISRGQSTEFQKHIRWFAREWFAAKQIALPSWTN